MGISYTADNHAALPLLESITDFLEKTIFKGKVNP